MTGKNGEAKASLTEAAAALEAELKKFDELCAAARRIPLDSEKTMGRAAKAMQEATDSQEKTAVLVRNLVDAINASREHQQKTAEGLLARAQELQGRSDVLADLLGRIRVLGEDAKGIQQIVAQANQYGTERNIEGAIGALEEARTRMDAIATAAEALGVDARAANIVDVEREADSLRQQLLSARNKLGLLQKTLSSAKS